MIKRSSIFTKGLLIFLVCIFLSVTAYAAPISNKPMTVTQPDGSLLNCFASGDEFFNYLHDSGGNIIMRHPKTGYYVYAMLDEDGKLAASGNTATDIGLFSAFNQGVTVNDIDFNINSHLIHRLPQPPKPGQTEIRRFSETEPDEIGIVRDQPVQGNMENIIVMICFSNEDPTIGDEIKSEIDSVFNSGEESLKDYLQTLSDGMLTLNSTLVGMNDGTSIMFKDSHPRSYYMPYHETMNSYGYKNDEERTEREHVLLNNAVNAINGSGLLDGKELDIDEDGDVDSITFIISGDVDDWNRLLWPHKWILNSYETYLNGKRAWTYSFQLVEDLFPGGSPSNMCLPTICHETLHTFSFPDLYRYYSDGIPVGTWDIMATTVDVTYPNIHTTLKYAGWGERFTEITDNGRYTLYPLGSKGEGKATAYAIATDDYDEFITLEYRSYLNNTGYDQFFSEQNIIYEPGLIITRINTEFEGNSNYNNPGGTDDEVYIYRPGETQKNQAVGDTWDDIAIASLSADAYRTSFGRPSGGGVDNAIYLYDGVNTTYVISNVSEAGETISFDVRINSNKSVDVAPQSGTLAAGTAGFVTFNVKSDNIDVGEIITLNNINNTEGVSLDAALVKDSGRTEITVRTTKDTPEGTHSLAVSIDGVMSNTFTLTVGSPNNAVVCVGTQTGVLDAGSPGRAVFPVTTNIASGSAIALVSGSAAVPGAVSPTGAVLDKVLVNNDEITGIEISLTGKAPQGVYPMKLSITDISTQNIVTSNIFFLYIGEEPSRLIIIGEQNGTLTEGSAGSAEYTVNTANIAEGRDIELIGDIPGGIVFSPEKTTIGAMMLTISTLDSTPAGNYPLKLKADGVESNLFYLTVKEAEEYTLTVSNAGAGAYGGGRFKAGEVISIYAGTIANYDFNGWTSSNGGYFGNAGSASTTFVMPANDTVVSAGWKYTGGSGGNYYNGDYNSDTGTGGSSSAATAAAVTSYDDIVLGKLKKSDELSVSMPGDTNNIILNGSTLLNVLESGEPLTVTNGAASIILTPDIINGLDLKDGGKVEIAIKKTAVKLPEGDAAKSDKLNEKLLTEAFDIIIKVDGRVVTALAQPLPVRVDVTKHHLSDGQWSKLTGIRYLDGGGYNQLGGEKLSAKGLNNMFEFKISKLSSYGILISDNLTKIKTAIGKNQFTVNGRTASMDVTPVIVDGYTMVPIRFIAEALGAEVMWYESEGSRLVTIALDGETIRLEIGKKESGMPAAPIIMDGRTMVPLRYISEKLGSNVIWNEKERSIDIYR